MGTNVADLLATAARAEPERIALSEAATGRTVPGLRDRQLSEDEQAIVHQNVAKVRATLDWIETAVDTGKVDMDDELAKLLKGE